LKAQTERDREAALDSIKNLYASSQLWKACTRGTASHYHMFFPEDNYLKLWRDLAAVEESHKMSNISTKKRKDK